MNRAISCLKGVVLCIAIMGVTSVAATAQGGGSGGGSGGGGGTGGGGGAAPTTITVQMNNYSRLFNSAIPQGVVTFTFTKNLTSQDLDIEVANVDVPDGTVVTVQALDALRVTGRCWHYEYYHYSMLIMGGKGSLLFSTSKGEVVPFLDPNKGWTQISIIPDTTTGIHILDGLLPFKGRL